MIRHLFFSPQGNVLTEPSGAFVADCKGMPARYRTLFEAAPDLLQAAEFIQASHTKSADGTEITISFRSFNELCAAIAKARGVQ